MPSAKIEVAVRIRPLLEREIRENLSFSHLSAENTSEI